MTDVVNSQGSADSAPELEPIDLLLREGSKEELYGFRERVAADPMLALDLADTVTLIERLRTVRVEPNAGLAGRLNIIVQRADRRIERQRPRPSPPWLLAAAIAVLSFLAAAYADPLSLRQPARTLTAEIAIIDPPPEVFVSAEVPTAAELAHRDALAAMRKRFVAEDAKQLSEALELAVIADNDTQRDQLRGWRCPEHCVKRCAGDSPPQPVAGDAPSAPPRWP